MEHLHKLYIENCIPVLDGRKMGYILIICSCLQASFFALEVVRVDRLKQGDLRREYRDLPAASASLEIIPHLTFKRSDDEAQRLAAPIFVRIVLTQRNLRIVI